MLIMQKIVEKVSKKPLEVYLEENFFGPLGLSRLTYNPRLRKDTSCITPTENDTTFRHALIHGFVHDPAAAMMGGVAGNAGLFSDAGNLAVIMQMLLNGGTYGGRKFLDNETVSTFTARYFKNGKNRRGLIFDKPEIEKTINGPTAVSASVKAFGHTGFTGTAAWADPDNDLVYIFLSNRVYPDAGNNKLSKGNYRTDIMQVFYDVIEKYIVNRE
jgi:CubicO group peptidase (beta-lactamase class C family)